jgi:hypothetical protein
LMATRSMSTRSSLSSRHIRDRWRRSRAKHCCSSGGSSPTVAGPQTETCWIERDRCRRATPPSARRRRSSASSGHASGSWPTIPSGPRARGPSPPRQAVSTRLRKDRIHAITLRSTGS